MGFLPPHAGSTIIVPSELVGKAGSDYDIDKLSIYVPNYYYDPNIKSVYYNRSSLAKVFKQYFQYGLYKPLVLLPTNTIISMLFLSRHSFNRIHRTCIP